MQIAVRETAPLGRVGASLLGMTAQPANEERELVHELEHVGYKTLWCNEANGTRDVLVHAALLLSWTKHAAVGSSIASIWARDPVSAANGARALGDAYPGRFVFGVGVGHSVSVTARGHTYARPLSAMREYLDGMDGAEYDPPLPATRVPRLLAALAPRMLELARDRADGTHPMLVTPEHTAQARAVLGPDRLVVPKQPVLLVKERTEARRVARAALALYLERENYTSPWRRLGFGDDDLAAGGSDRLVDALVAWGDEDAILQHVKRHFDAGADHVVVQAVGPDAFGQLCRLAPALRDA